MIYKPIINYVLAAGIALGAALTPSTTYAHPPLGRAETRITKSDCQALRNSQKERCDQEYETSKPYLTLHQCGVNWIDGNGPHSYEDKKCIDKRTRNYNVVLAEIKTDLKECRTEADRDYQTCLKDNGFAEKKHYTAADFIFPSVSISYDSQRKSKEKEKKGSQGDNVKCTSNEGNERLCSCQPADKPVAKPTPKAVKKKKLTIEEICAQQKADAQGRCSYDRDQNLARTREELWEEATRTGNYEDFGRMVALEEVNAQNKYSLCGIEARLGEFECTKSAKEEQARQAQAKKDAAANRIKAYELCVKGCGKAVGDCHAAKKKRAKEINSTYRHGDSRGKNMAFRENGRDFFACFTEAEKLREKCLPKCGKNPHPEPEWQRGRIQGLDKIDTGFR
ncbi:MAG: hypothetical protein WCV90_01400 [Candidatus Woesearchaeota archaeon]|jgi:hypothetical protein